MRVLTYWGYHGHHERRLAEWTQRVNASSGPLIDERTPRPDRLARLACLRTFQAVLLRPKIALICGFFGTSGEAACPLRTSLY